jgi:Protein of unknown function (DUF1566)
VADDGKHKNPFTQILNKLDQILSSLDSGGGDGHYTLRWDTNHPSASRFVTLAAFHNQAVLDKNTGLVWEQAPSTTPQVWDQARSDCVTKNVGGTVGWRLPSVIELRSLQDLSLPPPFVPTTIFTGIQSVSAYWTATSDVGVPSNAWHVNFFVSYMDSPGSKTVAFPVWCVRGLMQEHKY